MVSALTLFALDEMMARYASYEIFAKQKYTIKQNWDSVCREARLNDVDKNYLWERQFLNPYSIERTGGY